MTTHSTTACGSEGTLGSHLLHPSHSVQGYCHSSINWVLKNSKWGKSFTSPAILFILEDKFTLISNLQLPSPSIGSLALVVPAATTKRVTELFMLAIALQEFEEAFRGAPGLLLPAAPWELHVPWIAQHPGSPALEPFPVFHCSLRAGDPNSGHTVQDNTALMDDQNALSPSFLTLVRLLFSTASSHPHQVSLQSIITLLTLSYTAHSKNIFINILLLILLRISMFQSATQYKEKTQPASVSHVCLNKKGVFSIQELKSLSMWYVHTEYTPRNASASHFFEDVTT